MRDCANSHKDSGNSLFSRQLFDEAIAQYSLALDTAPHQDPCRATFFNNRAACFQSKVILCSAISNCALLTLTQRAISTSASLTALTVWRFHICQFEVPSIFLTAISLGPDWSQLSETIVASSGFVFLVPIFIHLQHIRSQAYMSKRETSSKHSQTLKKPSRNIQPTP